jgi:hypothetical protein
VGEHGPYSEAGYEDEPQKLGPVLREELGLNADPQHPPTSVELRAQKIIDGVQARADEINAAQSPAYAEQTGVLFAPVHAAEGAMLDEATAAAKIVETKHAAADERDRGAAAQREINAPGAGAARVALEQARSAVNEAVHADAPAIDASAAGVIPAQSEGPDQRSSIEVAHDRALAQERDVAHDLALRQNARRDSGLGPTVREAAYEGVVEKEHTAAQKARAWLDRRLGRDSRMNADETKADH